ncbi:contact-dependent growth inhibition system immunity protein [Phenylobacterium sp.]|uniref:contact-dependent growth inhibition system immunity protein n=1 Tax=Phenylobacterium sp. TaxID=1871053 RepID=UPI0025DAF29A|nr:contact-dependent growth inhibition system immunity protein [Phenylobacterium sp.]
MDDEGRLEEVVGDCVLSGFISDQMALPSATLESLSGDGSLVDAGLFPSGLVRRVAKAWTTPLNLLTCAQARVLVGQKFGLQWLAAPVAVFLSGHPRAECDLYPGDLMCMALKAHVELLRFAPVETRKLLGVDFSWMAEEFSFDPDGTLLREATDDLTTARRLAGI